MATAAMSWRTPSVTELKVATEKVLAKKLRFRPWSRRKALRQLEADFDLIRAALDGRFQLSIHLESSLENLRRIEYFAPPLTGEEERKLRQEVLAYYQGRLDEAWERIREILGIPAKSASEGAEEWLKSQR